MTETPMMFASCALPGCAAVVTDAGDVCAGCRSAFGDMLRPVDTTSTREQIAAQLDARDAETRAALTARRRAAPTPEGETRRNQWCWLCEERRTCTRVENRWECPTCRTVRTTDGPHDRP